jgi:hypothetical protein
MQFVGEPIVGRGLCRRNIQTLPPPDLLLRGFLKGTIYSNNPRSLGKLKHNRSNEQAVGNTKTETLCEFKLNKK